MALEGGPIAWVATHRIHHQNTDKEGDPHSPNDGGLWAHMGWIITGKAMHQNTAELLPYVPDLRKQKFYMLISKYHWAPMAGPRPLFSPLRGRGGGMLGGFFWTGFSLPAPRFVKFPPHISGPPPLLSRGPPPQNLLLRLL